MINIEWPWENVTFTGGLKRHETYIVKSNGENGPRVADLALRRGNNVKSPTRENCPERRNKTKEKET